jgi:hypothetical protein
LMVMMMRERRIAVSLQMRVWSGVHYSRVQLGVRMIVSRPMDVVETG